MGYIDNYTKIGTCERCGSDVIQEYGFPVCTNDDCDHEDSRWGVQIDEEEWEFPTRYEAVSFMKTQLSELYPDIEQHDSVLAFELRSYLNDLEVHNLGEDLDLPDGCIIRLWSH